MVATLVLIGVIALVIIWGFGLYNSLVGARNLLKNSYSQIDVQLKRRHDLIPNLVETAKGYMKHESATLEAVIAARNQAAQIQNAVAMNPSDAETMKRLLNAESQLGASLGRFSVAVEAYPDLKANQNMGLLMEELASTENKISFARQAYNDAAMGYNNRREMFPGSLIADVFQFQPAPLFELANSSERELPKIAF